MSLPSLARIPAPPDPILGLAETYKADTRTGKVNLSSGVFVDDTGTTPVLGDGHRGGAPARRCRGHEAVPPDRRRGRLPRAGPCAGARGGPRGGRRPGRALATQTPGGTGGLRVAADLIRIHGRRPDAVDERADVAQPPAAVPRRRVPRPELPVHRPERRSGSTSPRCSAALAGASPGRRRAAPRRVPQPDRRGPVARPVAAHRRRRRGAAAAAARRPRLPGLRRRAARGCGRAAGARPAGRGADRVDLVLEDVLAVRGAGRGDARHRRVRRRRRGRPVARQGRRAGELLEPARARGRRRAHDPRRRGRSGPAGRPSSRRCATGSRTTGACSSRRSRRARSPATGRRSRASAGCSRCWGSRRDQVARLRDEHGVYVVGHGRINVAGFTPSNLDPFADALAAVLATS